MNKPRERLLVVACGSAHVSSLSGYLVRLRDEVADDIKLVTTAAGGRLLDEPAVRTLVSGVFDSLWRESPDFPVPHLQLAMWAQTVLVLPATADLLGKAANGIADDLASTLLLSAPTPAVFAPAMNARMWQAPAVRRNVSRLREDGHYVIEPVEGPSLVSTMAAAGDGHGPADDSHAVGPTIELVMNHTWHVVMRQLRAAAMEEANI